MNQYTWFIVFLTLRKVNLYVSDNVKVVNNVSTVFGRTNIKYRSVDEKIININLKGVVLFGGVSVKWIIHKKL